MKLTITFARHLVAAGSFLALAVFAPAVDADTIVAYSLFGAAGDQPTSAATESASNVTASDLVRGGGLVANPAANSFNSRGWATNAPLSPTVVNTSAYVEMGFDVDFGYVVLDELIIGSRSSGSGPAQIGVFTSSDGFTSPIHVIDQTAGWPNSSANGYVNSTIDLSSLGNVTGSFRVRFMNVGDDATADVTRAGEMDEASTWRVSDHLQFSVGYTPTRITGTVVPEPCTALMAFLALSLLAGARTNLR